MKELNEFLKYSDLFEIYKSLISEKQRMYLKAYFEEDNSLTEIAEAMKVSKQAVYDIIKKVCKKLDFYENELHIYKNARDKLLLLKDLRNNFNKEYLDKLIQKLEEDSYV